MKINSVSLVASFCGVLLFSSCDPFGCTDERATNYNSRAQEDDGTCEFTPRQIAFYTTSQIGGEIYIELDNKDIDAGGSYFGYGYSGTPSGNATFNFDPNDENYPVCGLSELAYFERNTSEVYYYDAHDKHGNVWSGTVRAEPGECKLVKIDRDSSLFGELLVYSTDQSSNQSISIIHNPTGNSRVDENKTERYSSFEIYSSSVPNCETYSGRVVMVSTGSTVLRIISSYRTTDITVQIESGKCTLLDVSSYL